MTDFPYHVFIVRCWLERGTKTAEWRFMVDNPSVDQHFGCKDLTEVSQIIGRHLEASFPVVPESNPAASEEDAEVF